MVTISSVIIWLRVSHAIDPHSADSVTNKEKRCEMAGDRDDPRGIASLRHFFSA